VIDKQALEPDCYVTQLMAFLTIEAWGEENDAKHIHGRLCFHVNLLLNPFTTVC
jgi:hypothetical protein